jgi:hypothetical protein
MTSDISRPLFQVLTQIMGISYVVKPTGAHHPNSGSQVTDLMLRVAILRVLVQRGIQESQTVQEYEH